MSEINANIIVEPIDLTVTQSSITQTVAVEPISLNVFTNVSESAPGGTTGQLQYKTGPTTFGGVANTSVAGGNLTFTNLANLKIDGGVNGYVLETDGTGVLNWTAQTGGGGVGSPGGSNTQVQYNDAGVFGGFAGFTFDEATSILTSPGNINSTSGIFNGDGGGLSNVVGANVVGTVATATAATTAGTVTSAAQPNITSTGTLSSLTVTNDITSTAGIFNGDGGGLSNITAANVTGLSLSQIANGTSNVEIATADGNVDFTVGGANVARMSTTGAAYPGVLAVNGNITSKNDITAESGALFVGDGGGLTNVSASTSIIENGTSNVSIAVADGNIDFSTDGVANVMRIFENSGEGYVNIPAGNHLTVAGNVFISGSNTIIGSANITTANIVNLNWPSVGFETALGNGTNANAPGGTAYGFSTDANIYAVAIGYNAHAPGQRSVAIGMTAGSGSSGTTRQVAIGESAGANCAGGEGEYGVAIGPFSGNSQGENSVAVGYLSGNLSGGNSVSVGVFSRATGEQGIAIGHTVSVGANAISIGKNASTGTTGTDNIAIGYRAGELQTSTTTINIGKGSGVNGQGANTIAIGTDAGSDSAASSAGQNADAIAIGSHAGGALGVGGQQANAIAIGTNAGYVFQGANSIAIGSEAGNSGVSAGQADNSIVLNATGAALTTSTADTFNVKPVRNAGASGLPTGFFQVAYNPTTGEFVYYT
jgi:hypothetical protein